MRGVPTKPVWAAAVLAGALLAASAAPAGSSDQPEWIRTGGPLGGLGYDVRMAPRDPDVMLVTDAYAGVFRSEDGGVTWRPANEGIVARTGPSGDGIPIFSLTIDPGDPDIVWAGTQNTRGIYRSEDGGVTWTEKDRGVVEVDGITFRGFAVDPRDSNVVYAAAELSSWVWAGRAMPGREFDRTGGVVYKTTDAGEHWTEVWRGENLARYVWIDPRDGDLVYVSTGIFDREAADSDPDRRIPGGEGIIKSTDGGATWQHANDGLGNLYVGSLFMQPEDPDVLLAGTGNNQYYEGAGAYLSTDAGGSWEQVIGDDVITSVEFTTGPAYAGSERAIYRSEDGGRTWHVVAGGEEGWGPPGVRAGFPIDMQADPRDPDRLFVNNYGGGNFLSTDGGRTWATASNGYTGAQARDVAADPGEPGRVYVAARSGPFVSDDGGGVWRGLGFGPAAALEFQAIAVDPADPRHLIAGSSWWDRALASRDGGLTWSPVGPSLGEGRAWRVLAFAGADSSVVYAGSGAYRSAGTFDWGMEAAGIFVSHDGGTSWGSANTAVSEDAQVAGIAVHPEFVGFVYAASSTHGLLRTFDGGIAWEAVGGGLPAEGMALSVVFDPGDPEVQLAGYAGTGLFRSSDGGATWRRVAAGLPPEATVTDLVFDPALPGRVYLAEFATGVYLSDDSGATWRPTSNGLRTRAVNALALGAGGAHLYAATEGEGTYRLDLDGTPPEAADALWRLDEPQIPEPEPATSSPEVPPPATTAAAPGTTTAPPSAASSGDPGGGTPWLPIGTVSGGLLLGVLIALAVGRRRRAR
jgi:photosystem II stability/assembly factor-like uncharacterized protein